MTTTFRPLPGIDLPIYRLDGPQYISYYAPGCLCVVDPHDAHRFETSIVPPKPEPPASAGVPSRLQDVASPPPLQHSGRGWGSELGRYAERAVREAERRCTEPFQPECLTLYLNNECNLCCTYCFARPLSGPRPSPGPAQRLDLEAIAAAADVVAASCRKKGCIFYAVFHGGGEPTLFHERLAAALALVEDAARTHDVEIYRYVATHGVLATDQAAWLAGHFDLIGISCDGPPAIQDRQRPRDDGRESSQIVDRTAHILRQEGAAFHVRATVTKDSLYHQAEIAEYICDQLAPQEIQFEPIYLGGWAGTTDRLTVDHAADYVAHFLAAQRVAQEYGIPLLGSGSRPSTIHGPYCHVFRRVLNLVPGGLATACFKLTRAEEVRKKGAAINALNPVTGRFEIVPRRIRALRQRLGAVPVECQDCFNRYHCVRECPDYCPLDDPSPGDHFEPGFRCNVQKATTRAILEQAAGRLWTEIETGREQGPRGTRDFEPGTA